ncbi:uncharacterized protein LOC108680436 [Hyalella azteca]|uniref:non-specific serine/threonine protein kinase n=1 Tax=Hyalella azteca TaxID=294128 RepID=A0A8B7PGP7_HYAAZ|nr:uncharacterized protein LOC108680436 [Hyalella azteca]
MAFCGETVLPGESTIIAGSNCSTATCSLGSDVPSPPKLAWGGAGMVPIQASSSKENPSSWAPTEKSKSRATFSFIQSEDLAEKLELEETEKLMRNQAIHYYKLTSGVQPEAGISSSGCTSNSLSTSPNTLLSSHDTSASVIVPSACAVDGDSTANDHMLAQMLQYEFDLEHDMNIERTQRHANKNSKLSISYNKYKLLPSFASENIDNFRKEDDPIDEIEVGELEEPVIPSCGYVEHYGKLITKHDSVINSRKNAKKMLSHLPLDVNTGDAGGFAISMSNKVYNQLRESLHADTRRKQRVHDKAEKGTVGAHMDEGTSVTLLALVNSEQLEELGGVISSGKEAIVYHAIGGRRKSDIPSSACHSVKNIKLWVEKEYRNLCRASTAGVPCPVPIVVRHNLLVMSLIGDPDLPAPQLRNVQLSAANWQLAYEQTIQIVEVLVNKCRLVHADLSEYNLLYYQGTVYVIDFAQAVDLAHPRALSYLYRDLCNVANFFRRRGVAGVQTGLELLESITKLDIRRSAFMTNTEQVSAREHELDMWRGSDCYDDAVYEFLWSASQQRLNPKNHDEPGSSLPENLLNLKLEQTGTDLQGPWVTRKTDASVIGMKSQKKKKRNRKNSSSKGADKSPGAEESSPRSLDDEDSSGFCVIDSSDCTEGASSKSSAQKNDDQLRGHQRVRFNVSDTDAVDTEDYNADADTDDFDPDTDTDVNVTDHDGDTEGYCGDADDTDNYASDLNDFKMVHSVNSKAKNVSDKDDSSDQQQASLPSKSSLLDKRNIKKKNKKAKGKSGNN